jgi:curved DNA-binding protein
MEYKDYYAALGVAADASPDDIKKAYRKLARKYHPDVSKAADAEARFKQAAEAYGTLKDPDRRASYDAIGRRPAGEQFAPPPEWAADRGFDAHAFDGMDLGDLFDALGRGRRGARADPRPAAGRDYETTVEISLEEASRGTTVRLQLDAGVALDVTIPPAVRDGQKLRLRGKGGKGRDGGADGDIYLHITLKPHAVFRADQHDLHFDLALAPWEAALGAQVEVPTLDGPVVLAVPPGTRAGRKLRLRGRGLARSADAKGDLYAHVRIDVPGSPTQREKELFQELARASTFNPRASAKEK